MPRRIADWARECTESISTRVIAFLRSFFVQSANGSRAPETHARPHANEVQARASLVSRALTQRRNHLLLEPTVAVKPAAFYPAPNNELNGRLETSVFTCAGLPAHETQALLAGCVLSLSNPKLLGWAIVSRQAIEEVPLGLDVNDIPRWHAAIIDWTGPTKDFWLASAQQLCLASSTTRIDPPALFQAG